ncbi:MAG: PEP-utilizing enzyme [Polyangiaceae bacterium]
MSGPESQDELALLLPLAGEGSTIPSVVVERGPVSESALAAAIEGATFVVLRAAAAEDGTFLPAVLCLARPLEDETPELTRLAITAAATYADACCQVSLTRFTSSLPRGAIAADADVALAKLCAASGVTLQPPSFGRVLALLNRLRERSPSHARLRWLVQRIDHTARWGWAARRDPRTGLGPARGALHVEPRSALDGAGPSRELGSFSDIPVSVREELERVLDELERETLRPIRVGFELSAGGASKIMQLALLRRGGAAAIPFAVDLARRGVVSRRRAISLVEPHDLEQASPLEPIPAREQVLTRGVAAGGGVAEGLVCFTPAEAERVAAMGLPALLVVHEISPEDVAGLRASVGILTVRGGITGEAAVMARALGKPCVASGAGLTLTGEELRAGSSTVARGERLTIDGRSGLILRGACALGAPSARDGSRDARDSTHDGEVATLLEWLREETRELRVLAIVQHATHVTTARTLDAAGVLVAGLGAWWAEAHARGPKFAPNTPLLEQLRAIATEPLAAICAAAQGMSEPVRLRLPGVGQAAPFGELGPASLDAIVGWADEVATRAGVAIECVAPIDELGVELAVMGSQASVVVANRGSLGARVPGSDVALACDVDAVRSLRLALIRG